MTKENLSEIADIINNTQDIIKGGWKTEHPEIQLGFFENRTVAAASAQIAREAASPGLNDSLGKIAEEVAACRACGLCNTRNKPVPGAGVINPAVMFIGEGPGGEEDKTGIPFVGRAGQYLDKWLSAIDLDRHKDCFIGNIIKCRPPGNRDPQPDEIAACRPFLSRQLKLIKPKIIITLGRFASQVICSSTDGIGRLRGSTHSYEGIPVVPTYHPSAVLRNPELRGAVWKDLKRAKDLITDITHE